MPSRAFAEWTGVRRTRIAELYAAHAAVGGSGPGRRIATEQLNGAIALRLAAEFQGYARSLHDEAAAIVTASVATSPAMASVVEPALTLRRQLDSKNATGSTLQQDFGRFGFKIVDEIKASYAYGVRWFESLEELNAVRNGVAHADVSKIHRITVGATLRLSHVRTWDSSIRGLAEAVDRVTADHIATLTGGGAPW